jgi:hypothetical protein
VGPGDFGCLKPSVPHQVPIQNVAALMCFYISGPRTENQATRVAGGCCHPTESEALESISSSPLALLRSGTDAAYSLPVACHPSLSLFIGTFNSNYSGGTNHQGDPKGLLLLKIELHLCCVL